MKAYKISKKIQELGKKAELRPYSFVCTFGSLQGNEHNEICFSGDQISFGEDYVDIETAREATEWIVGQLGGSVKWED